MFSPPVRGGDPCRRVDASPFISKAPEVATAPTADKASPRETELSNFGKVGKSLDELSE